MPEWVPCNCKVLWERNQLQSPSLWGWPDAVTVSLRVTSCSHCLVYFTWDREIVVTMSERVSQDLSMYLCRQPKTFWGNVSFLPLPRLLIVIYRSSLEMKTILFTRYLLTHKCSRDRELSLKSYSCCLSGSIIREQANREDAYVYSRVHSSIMEKRATTISFHVLSCPFLEAKWCGELFIIIVPQISTMPFC